MERRNLIVVRAGDMSLHRRWMDDSRSRNFDLLVSYYGRAPGRYQGRCDHYHAMTGPRWPAHDWLWRNRRELFDRYERVAFVCDDVDAVTRVWNAMFNLCEWFDLDLAQPAITGYVNVPITMPVAGSVLRYTDWVEVMCPVFSRRALAICGDTFRESVSGWSLGRVWGSRLPHPDYRIAIVDALTVAHTSVTRQGDLRPVLDALGIEPSDEAATMLARLGLERAPPREIGQLPIAWG